MLVDWDISIRRACKVLKFGTSSYHCKSRRTGQAPLERRIKEICETRVRYGYRRVHVHLRRDGWKINMEKTRRIYSELGLQLRNKHPKRRVIANGSMARSSISGNWICLSRKGCVTWEPIDNLRKPKSLCC
jgi:hypothetical protein